MTNITLNTATRKCTADKYFLGYEGENNINKLIFKFEDGFRDGLGILNVKRGEEKGYLDLKKVGDTYELEVKSALLSKIGEITFQLTVNEPSGIVIKYDAFSMAVKDSIDTDVEMPEDYPNWIDMANAKLVELDETISKVKTAKENGEFNGKDGFSPVAKVTQTEEGAEIEITDENGTTKAVVRHGQGGGEGGGTGVDGFSPIANVTQTDDGAIISVTDKTGTSTAIIKNGKNGEKGDPGEAGADGLTPYIGENGNWWIGEEDTGVKPGGLGGGSGVARKVLFEGDFETKDDFSPSGLLSDNIKNYEYIILTAYQKVPANGNKTRIVSTIIDTQYVEVENVTVGTVFWSIGNFDPRTSNGYGYAITGNFGDGTQLAMSVITQSGVSSRPHGICKVVGFNL